MGIPYYFSYLIKNHSEIINKLKNHTNIDNIYIDSNSIIYDSLDFNSFTNKQQFEDLIIEKVIEKIDLIIKTLNPKKHVFIAFDGIPPIAKLDQQKNRRYKSWYQNTILNKTVLWDTSSITPGTKFMDKLNTIIQYHFTSKKSKYKITLSLSDIPGEGEHKIFHYIRNNNHDNDKTIIYGMDADLIMLSLNHLKNCNSIYLYRETPIFIRSLDSRLDKDETYLLDISKLGKQIYKELTDCDCHDLNNEFYQKIEDYIFICFLLGNDFMPHFPAINIRTNGFICLLELYKTHFKNKQLTNNGIINWKTFKFYIYLLAKNEYEFLLEQYKLRERASKKFYPESNDEEREFKFIATPSYERNIEIFINPREDDWEFRYYYALFDINQDTDKQAVSEICLNYLKTLQWTLHYYRDDCKNWQHHYHYNYPPLLQDLVQHIPYFDSELVLDENHDIVNKNVLLSYVLPRTSLNLLPKKIETYLLKNYSEHYKEDYEFEWSFCKYFWEGHVKFPKLDFQKFSKTIENID
tara:strand:+ start:870 stop:2435 length:1566 start_codon:yes stop_codon:yes gene_type:complete